MKFYPILICIMTILTGCNSVYVKPNSLDTNETIFADRGGYSMRRSIKESMQERGYNVVVGKATSSSEWTQTDGVYGLEITSVPRNAKYTVKVTERSETFRPFWCALNGFWWWNFNVSISDQDSGEEIMTWRGRGCANSSLRLFNKILDKMEK